MFYTGNIMIFDIKIKFILFKSSMFSYYLKIRNAVKNSLYRTNDDYTNAYENNGTKVSEIYITVLFVCSA